MRDRATRWLRWLIFDRNPEATKKKSALAIGMIWISDTLFFTGSLGNLILACFLLVITLIALIPFAPTALGIADKLELINLTTEQSMVRRFIFIVSLDVYEWAEVLLEYLFGG